MNADGTVKRDVRFDLDTIPNYTYGASYPFAIDVIGDLDGDGVQDLVLGLQGDESVVILFMSRDGSLKDSYELNTSTLSFYLGDSPDFGRTVE